MEKLSVAICAYNPDEKIFNRVIEALQNQTLNTSFWELLIIDNNSSTPISNWLDISWHPESRIVKEPKPGLIYARNRVTLEAKHEYIISVDDDTILCDTYLETALSIFNTDLSLGIIGGRSKPIYLEQPPKWINQFDNLLAIRDLGETTITEQINNEVPTVYPVIAPILIATRKKCMQEYSLFFEQSLISKNLGRKGNSLSSGEDNDINMFIYSKGYKIGYFPELEFEHIIPKFRTTKKYLSNMAYESSRSWVKMLENHRINNWQKIMPYTVLIRQVKAYFVYKAWSSTPNYIKWRGACGLFKGLSEL